MQQNNRAAPIVAPRAAETSERRCTARDWGEWLRTHAPLALPTVADRKSRTSIRPRSVASTWSSLPAFLQRSPTSTTQRDVGRLRGFRRPAPPLPAPALSSGTGWMAREEPKNRRLVFFSGGRAGLHFVCSRRNNNRRRRYRKPGILVTETNLWQNVGKSQNFGQKCFGK